MKITRLKKHTLYQFDNNTQILYNGILYLVNHLDISKQFIGSGLTIQEALEDANTTARVIQYEKPTKIR